MRTLFVTGSASGLGAAVCERLIRDGHHVIGCDRADADVVADLGTPEGRRCAVEAARDLAAGRLDGVVSCAGLGPTEPAEEVASVNYFGAVAVLDELRGGLARGRAPAAVAISSAGAIFEALAVPDFVEACLAGDEPRAHAAIRGKDGNTAYVNAKRALALAVRSRAPAWGAAGIRLNALAPGKMETPMLERLLADEGLGDAVRGLPVPLGRSAPAREIAGAVAFLLGPDAGYVHGQVLFADGGMDAVTRPDAF